MYGVQKKDGKTQGRLCNKILQIPKFAGVGGCCIRKLAQDSWRDKVKSMEVKNLLAEDFAYGE
jgi:hypothetical protein